MAVILKIKRSLILFALTVLPAALSQGRCILLHELNIDPAGARSGAEARADIKDSVAFSYYTGIYLQATAQGIEVAGFSAEAGQEAVDSIASTEFFTGIIDTKTYTGTSVDECQDKVQKAGFLIYFPGGMKASILNALARCRLEETGRIIQLSDTIKI